MEEKEKCKCSIVKNRENSLDDAAKLYFNDPSAERLEAVMNAGEKLIKYFIRLYGGAHSIEDLFQVGAEGLLKALKRYDPSNGSAFTTYAGCLIMGEIRHYVRKEISYYRPRTVEKLQNMMDELLENQLLQNGEVPCPESIAKKLNLKEEGVYEVMRCGLVPLDELNLSKVANIKHESFKLPVEDRIMLEQAVKRLSDTQQKVIDMLFFKGMSQVQTAENLDINQRKVSRVLHNGLESLKKMLA